MSVVIGCLVPHPPIIIPEIGKNEVAQVSNTINAMKQLAKDVAYSNPETLVFISPHTAGFADAIAISNEIELRGSFASFGAGNVKFLFPNNLDFVKTLISEAQTNGLDMVAVDKSIGHMINSTDLDHGVLVPLYYLRQEIGSIPIVSIAIDFAGYEEHFRLGQAIRETARQLNTKVAFIASGDMSHRLIPGAPAGYSPRGADFDSEVNDILMSGNLNALADLDPSLIEAAGECGLRSLYTLSGVFHQQDISAQVLSYEGPFGVGYLVAEIIPKAQDAQDSKHEDSAAKDSAFTLDAPIRLAQYSLEQFLKTGREVPLPENLPKELLERRAGVFVCLKIAANLRGCVGTIEPTQPTVAQEIMKNAVQAAVSDPRFHPVAGEELPHIKFSVDILGEPEKIRSVNQLDPKLYGVIVRRGIRSGLLLPDLEGVDTPEMQVSIAKQKAGLLHYDEVEMYRFTVTRYE